MTDPSKDDKKDCNINTCAFNFLLNTKDVDEKEIKTVDLCNDPACSNIAEKKLVDLTAGLSQLENILKNMTGLCREPKCPTRSPSVQAKIEASVPPLPQPNRYPAERISTEDESKAKPKQNVMDQYKSCKGAICYNAYMGYKIESPIKERPPQTCGSQSCVPMIKPPKPCCASPTCPFSKKKDTTTPESYPATSIMPPKTTMGPCGGFTCPTPKTDLFISKFAPPTNFFDFNLTTPSTPLSKPCTFDTCPLSKQQEKDSQVPVGLCGRTSCPYASVEYAQRLDDFRPNTPVNYNFGDINTPGICDNPTCPFDSQSPGGSSSPCGDVSCPYGSSQKSEPPKVGTCGRTSCPFASITPNYQARTTAPCGNPCCCSGQTSYDPVGLCGQAECPMLSKTSPGAVKPCPFADKIKRYPCGSPSCPYVNPSGMLHTHEYGNDRSYVQEAARPYSGSASPYDYMSSLQPSYPSPYAENYPLFTYTQPPPLPPCPYLPKKTNKSCGKPTCPYADGKRPKDDFCIESTCPFGEGICGGPRKFSCDSPLVEHCESPDCLVSNKKNAKGKCRCCGGIMDDDESDEEDGGRGGSCSGEGPKKKEKKRGTCCRMQEVEPEEKHKKRKRTCCRLQEEIHDDGCGKPTCPKSASKKYKNKSHTSTRSLISGMSLNDYEALPSFHRDESTTDAGKCCSKTCPYLKKLVFCDDCGGVLPDEDTPESSYNSVEDTAEEMIGSMEGEIERTKSDTTGMRASSLNKVVDVVDSPTKGQKTNKEVDIKGLKDEEEKVHTARTVDLYNYPGVQIGHKGCDYKRRLIPRNMGWLWNVIPTFGNPELWRGYKPGAICKTVYRMMKEHRRQLGLIAPNEKKKQKRRLKIEDLKHCIEVKKKEGDYMITVNPVKDPKTRDPLDNPYMDVTPIQFKVEKEPTEKEQAYCPCDEVSDLPTATSSEFEFHFTPPAAIPETIVRKHKTMAEAVVQYDCMDLPPEMRAKCKSDGKGGKKGGKGGKGGKKGKKGKKK